MGDDSDEINRELAAPRRRRRLVMLAASVVLAAVIAVAVMVLLQSRLTFPYNGPSEAISPGGAVEIHATGEACGPLIVSLHSPSILGQWNQTHSGNVVRDTFTADAKSWWSLSSRSYSTSVPCSTDGTVRFTLPTDVTGTVVAACDSDRRCAKVHVDQSGEG